MFEQVLDPVGGSLALSALVAALPLLTLFVLLGALKVKAWLAGLISLAVALVLAIVAFRMPVGQAVLSATEGAAFGFFPILWIVINAIWVYNLTVATGHFDVLRRSFEKVSPDQRIQAIIIAFCFGALLEALARKSRDISEFIVEMGPVAERHPLPMTVAYQDACHLAHAQGIREEPRKLLRGIPGIELKPLTEAELCCGSAGTYNMLQPEPARELGERKAAAVLATGADLMVTANPGCWMQVATTLARMGKRMPVAHTVQVLDASIRGVPVEDLLDRALNGPGTALARPVATDG